MCKRNTKKRLNKCLNDDKLSDQTLFVVSFAHNLFNNKIINLSIMYCHLTI